MTDISESGIEAALDEAALWDEGFTSHPREYQVLRMDGDDIQTVSRHPDRGAMEDALKAARMRAAIQAYLPFHPPASREEGLRVDLALIEATARKINPGRSEDHIKSVALDALTIFRALQSKKPE